MNNEIIINKTYKLSPITAIDKDDIHSVLSVGKGVYVCSFPDEAWHKHYKLDIKKNYSIQKKRKMFELLSKDSIIISPTEVNTELRATKQLKINNVVHLSSYFKKSRLKQIEYSLRLCFYVFTNRKKLDYVFYYNFEMPIFFTTWFIKHILKLKIYVDFEDDYTLISRNPLKNWLNKQLFKIPDFVVCINKEMTKHFNINTKCLVFNGFIDLSYINNISVDLNEGCNFLYAGSLDEIRGVDLLPEIVRSLKSKISAFKIRVTGSGPLEEFIKNVNIPEIEFLGFLSEDKYTEVLQNSDCFLVLQKPDHSFNRGSFPSKIEYYAAFKKPIYSLKLLKD